MLGSVPFPGWEPHPDVWLVVGLLAAGYAIAVVRLGPQLAPAGTAVVTRFQVACWSAGTFALLVASDYPVHDLGERYLFSVHMLQHTIFSVIAAPLLLLGTPAWLARYVLRPPALMRSVRYLSRFIPATILFNVVVVVTHAPFVVNAAVRNGGLHFLVHVLVFVSALVVWMPLLSPLPEVPRLVPVMRMVFLFLQSVVPTVPASFLTFGSRPLYRVYEDFPRLWNISALDDMRVAGLIMKIAVGFILWIMIAIIFFRWYQDEEGRAAAPSLAHELDRELIGMQQS
jgi:putative membrane protein